jgi:hypothetical protein
VLYDDIREDVQAVCRSIYEFLEVDPDFTINDDVKHNSVAGEPAMKWLVSGLFSKNAFKRKLAALLPKKVRMMILYLIIKPLLKRKSLDEATIKNISAYYEQDILKLEKLIQRDLSAWRYRV